MSVAVEISAPCATRTEDFGARLRVHRGRHGRFAPIDPERWAKERRYHEANLPDVMEALRVRRQASLDLLASVSAETLEGSRPQKQLGSLSGQDILAAWVTHDRIHLAQLAGTLARIWALRWAPLHAEDAGLFPTRRTSAMISTRRVRPVASS